MARSILSNAAILVATTTAMAATSGCDKAPERAPALVQSVNSPPSAVPPPSPSPSSEPALPQTSASASAAPPATALAEVPLLEAAKGKSALEAYRTTLKQACGKGADRRKALAGIGLDIEDEGFICVDLDHAGEALASGSLVEAGADEVLVKGPSGRSWAGGDAALALMRNDGTSYKLVKHMRHGHGWAPKIRVATPSGRDVLMLCEEEGHMGEYSGMCGFLDDLSFRPYGDEKDTSKKNGIPTFFATTCGPQKSATLGKIEFRDNRLYAPLFVEEYVLEREPTDEGDTCSRKKSKGRKMFTIEYRFEGTHFQRVTAIPRVAN